MLVVKLAIRNLFRNIRRTILTVMLIGFSLSALIFTDSLIKGMQKLMVENVTQSLSGEAQIHQTKYRDNQDVNLYIKNTNLIEDKLQKEKSVSAYAIRVISGGMISSSYNVTAGGFYGVDAEKEEKLSKLKDAIKTGNYLSGLDRELILGQQMADLLEVKLGDRIVVTLSEVDSGELTQALYRVSGIFEFGIREIDENLVFVNIASARNILGLDSESSHEIALKFVNKDDAKNRQSGFFKAFNNEEIETLGWLDLNPEIASVIEMTSYSSFILGAILFSLATLGIINSLFMSIYERIYEIGVMRAIGSKKSKLMQLIILEALFLALIACIFGCGLSFIISSWTSVHGIPLGEMEVSGMAISNNIITQSTLAQYIEFPLYVILLTLIASIYPARFASKISPSEALQKSL